MLLCIKEGTAACSQACLSSRARGRLRGAVLHHGAASVRMSHPRPAGCYKKHRPTRAALYIMRNEHQSCCCHNVRRHHSTHLCSWYTLLLDCCGSPANGCTELVCPWLHLHDMKRAEMSLRCQPALSAAMGWPLLLQDCKLDPVHRSDHRQAAHQPSTKQKLHARLIADAWHAT